MRFLTRLSAKIVVRLKDSVLRIYDGDRLMATLAQSPVKGKLVQLPGLQEAILSDRKMNARKYARPPKGKGNATISPRLGKYAVDVERRPLSVYAQIGEGVGYV
jgi:hypothetical protein